MARKSKSRRAKAKPAKVGWWASLDTGLRRRLLRGVGTVVVVVSVTGAGSVATTSVDQYVRRIVSERADPTVAFVDLPDGLVALARPDLDDAVGDVLTPGTWLDDEVCRRMGDRLEQVGWVSRVNYVRRTSDARFHVSCRYRQPAAMVQQDEAFFLVGAEGVRLPGKYLYNPALQLIQGVEAPAPPAGTMWSGGDLRAALRILEAIRLEPFAHQITAVLVGNFEGRLLPERTHIELVTDRAGGRIRWGSAPGRELEENSLADKIAILRENYRRTGRVDAGQSTIDISAVPNGIVISE
ncbi:MAG: cell division protein FtsQ/DivIB [Phycisphaerae bacterium]